MGLSQSRADVDQGPSVSPVFVLQHGSKRVLISRPSSYMSAVARAYQCFPQLVEGDIVLQTNQLDICEGEYLDVNDETWLYVIDKVSLLLVSQAPMAHSPALYECYGNGSDDGSDDGFDGAPAQPRDLLFGRKPVIYLLSPIDIEASVTLSLTSDWTFSAIYPIVPRKASSAGMSEQIRWQVRTHSDGSLTETVTGQDVSYLFWEAYVNTLKPPSPPASPVLETPTFEDFSPLSCDVSDHDSVLLTVNEITIYLDKSLRALGLHTEARTSFITYWLPYFLKHTHIALRFVPQSSFSRAAPLDIVPQPDVMTRVFMLFKGIGNDQVSEWPNAAVKAADQEVEWWRTVVGVEIDRALDSGLFRVLEWGGMEVV